MTQPPRNPTRKFRCYTRAIKNAHFLKQHDPATFAKDTSAPGFGTGLPMDILQILHRLKHDSPELKNHPQASEFLRKHTVHGPQGWKP